MKTNNIPSSLCENIENRISYHSTTRMYVKTIAYAVLALVSVLPLLVAGIDPKSPLYFLLGILAVLFILLSVSTIAFTKKEPRLTGTASPLSCHLLDFNATPSVIIDDIEHSRIDHLKSMLSNAEGGTRLYFLLSADGTVAQYRLYHYVPFEYQPVTSILPIAPSTASSLIRL